MRYLGITRRGRNTRPTVYRYTLAPANSVSIVLGDTLQVMVSLFTHLVKTKRRVLQLWQGIVLPCRRARTWLWDDILKWKETGFRIHVEYQLRMESRIIMLIDSYLW